MKKTIFLLMLLIVCCFPVSAWGVCDCNGEACGVGYCNELMQVWGTSVCDQGNGCRGNSQGRGIHQCVNLFKRVEKDTFNHTVGSVGYARNVYINATSANIKLQRFPNGSTDVPPLPAYHLVYDHRNGVGHVATIVSLQRVDGKENEWNLTVAEQNWTREGFFVHILRRDPDNNTYIVNARGSYSVSGWVRNPALEFVGKYSDGFKLQDGHSNVFADAYAEALGKLNLQLGSPWGNSVAGPGTKYVHSWPDDKTDENALWVQDFRKADGTWSMLVLNNDQAFVVTSKILEFWTSHSGYSEFGPPLGNAVESTPSPGQKMWKQEFQKGVIGYWFMTDGSDSGEWAVITSDDEDTLSFGSGGPDPGTIVSIATRPVSDIPPLRMGGSLPSARDNKLGLSWPGTLDGPFEHPWTGTCVGKS